MSWSKFLTSKIKIKQPFAIRWKIPEAKLQELKDSIGDHMSAAVSTVNVCMIDHTQGGHYSFWLYPNGYDEETRGQTWVYHRMLYQENIEVDVVCTVSIESAKFSRPIPLKDVTSLGEPSNKGLKLCTTDELFDPASRLIVNGEMDILLDGFLMIETEPPVESQSLGTCHDSLGIDAWNQEDKDFTIVADGKEIKAHKFILSTRSPVFAAMFQPHTLESQEGKVVIPDFSFGIVESAIKFCYHHSLVGNIPLEDQILLLQFFDKYQIQSLKDKLENYMISEIQASNVCRFANAAITSNAAKLKSGCVEFLHICLKNTEPVCDFDLLDKDFGLDVLKKAFYQISDSE